ncbi:MAG: hypothetical protein QM762_02525 [Chryseolinea sp.]
MKTTTSTKAKKANQRTKIPKKGTRKNIESRDLNADDNTTNVVREEEWGDKKVNDSTLPSDRSVEDEEDRESKRKSIDANPAEDIQN